MYRWEIDYPHFEIVGDRGHVVYSYLLEGGHIYVGQTKRFHHRITEHLSDGWEIRKWQVLAGNLTRRQAEALELAFAKFYCKAGFRVYWR